jgi:bile acid acyltransferase/acyl-CoA thioester hydrolase-like protein
MPRAEIQLRARCERGFRHPLVHLRYPGGGHVCAGVPRITGATKVRHPLTGGPCIFGGTRAGNARARADSWPRLSPSSAPQPATGMQRRAPCVKIGVRF